MNYFFYIDTYIAFVKPCIMTVRNKYYYYQESSTPNSTQNRKEKGE